MFKNILRLLAFFGKEFHEVRRQPRLVLSLILGPVFVLLLFGIGYSNDLAPARISLVIPEALQGDTRIAEIESLIDSNYDLVEVHHERSLALADMDKRLVEVVEIFPENLFDQIEEGDQAVIEFVFDAIDPQKERFYEILAYQQIDTINKILVEDSVSEMQDEASSTKAQISETQQELNMIDSSMSESDIDETRTSIQNLRDALNSLNQNAAFLAYANNQEANGNSQADQLNELQEDLEAIDQSLSSGQMVNEDRIGRLEERLETMEQQLDELQDIPPDVVVSPLTQAHENTAGEPYDLMVFFAPNVLALILQHIAVTLGALSLVRERTRGALEFFGVAPISILQVLIGKYLAYLLFLVVISGSLLALMVFGLNVPLLGNLYWMLTFLTLYLIASIGIGFFISVVSRSETQAVQFSMLVLLMSVFFSGFILPLENFQPFMRYIGWILPITHANVGFQNMMLLGTGPYAVNWALLGAITLLTFISVRIIWGRHFRSLQF